MSHNQGCVASEDCGRKAFDTYNVAIGAATPLPRWEALPDRHKYAWRIAAQAAIFAAEDKDNGVR